MAKFYYRKNPETIFKFKIGDSFEVPVTLERVKRILSVTDKSEFENILEEEPKFLLDSSSGTIAKTFSDKYIQFMINDDNLQEHLELSAIQCTRRNMKNRGSYVPTLKQGVIVKEEKIKSFMYVFNHYVTAYELKI